MVPRILVLLPLVALLVACDGGSDAPNFRKPDPIDVPPHSILDLRHWMLTLPVDTEGGTTGPAANIKSSELLGGYSSEWFHGSRVDGREGVTFWAPVNGARTARAKYPRSELREMLNPSDSSVNWTTADTATMTATVAINQTPLSNGKVAIGQIVAFSETDPDVSELVKLIFEYNHSTRQAVLYALVMDTPQPSSPTRRIELTRNLALNDVFSYTIEVRNGEVRVSSGPHAGAVPITDAWNGVEIFFRAGVSPQALGTSSTDGGRVTFYDLDVVHSTS